MSSGASKRGGGRGGGGRKEGGDDGSTSSSLSALDAERCGLAEALGIFSRGPGGESRERGSDGSDGSDGGGGVSLVEWADRLGGSGPPSACSTPPPPSSSAPPFRLPDEQRVLEVGIEPLPASRAADLSSRHPRLSPGGEVDGEGDENDREEGDEEEEFDEFADTRWRRITLRPRGRRAQEAAEETARALRELNAKGETVAIEQEEEEDEEEEREN